MDDYLKNYAVKELVEELNLSNIKQIKGKVMWDCDLMWEKKDDGWYIQVKPAFGNPPHVDIQWVFIALVKIYFIENNLTNNLAKDVSDLYRQVSFEEQDFKVIETGVYEIVASLDFLKCLLYLNKINKLHRPNLDEMCKLALTIPFREYLEYVFMQAMKRHMGGDITEFLNRFENLFDDKKRSEEFMNFLGALLYRGEYNYKDVIIILNHFFPDLKNLDLSKRLLSEITDLNEAIEVEKERQINLNLLTEFRKFEKN